MEKIYEGLKSRDNLAEELVQQYIGKKTPTIVCITGSHGTGKTYVVQKIVNQLEKNKKMSIYHNLGRNFVKFDSKFKKMFQTH